MKKIRRWLYKIFWEISKACSLIDIPWYCEELRKEILSEECPWLKNE